MIRYLYIIFYSILYICTISQVLSEDSKLYLNEKFTVLKIFQQAFLETRPAQIDAIQTILKNFKYEKQYEITNKAFKKIFEVISSGKVLVENSDYIPGSELPSNPNTTSAIAQIVHNTAMYGDFQLKLPDITDRIMKNHPDWLVLIKWAIGFSNATEIYDPKTLQMIDLLCQEMNLIERKENFINPYRNQNFKETNDNLSSPTTKPKKKTKKERGPRMTKPRRIEL
ncbi:hypothetical protein JTE90_021854 [Oedothorax gibbosus]|uniref:Coiled-coil domain-containing protein 134 n=1 Tax=Oedothorax gibbosus TaxID=931172 RepID=A0AAV6UYR3_9ARAC|nr:hypothetical protein JTE90_021854 [Oedothorax gibbosus]